jgi:NADH dehydrogenase
VTDIDVKERTVALGGGRVLRYDHLVLAAGGRTSYFGNHAWSAHALGLKTLDDALAMRRRILTSFERAEATEDEAERRRLMTLVVIGGGPTGVELAGALAELTRVVFRQDFRRINPAHARVLLIEALDEVLRGYPHPLCERAARQLERLGVQLHFGAKVTGIDERRVHISGGEVIESANVLWTAGIEAVPLTRSLGVARDRAGRVVVEPDLTVPGRGEVMVLGDAAAVTNPDGTPVPGIAPAAIQMGAYAADRIGRLLRGEAAPERFVYRDRGMMATIGRKAAVVVMGRLQLTGVLAWVTWLFVHLVFLIGLRNKITVVTHWVWAYVTYQRGARIIFGRGGDEPRPAAPGP